MAFDYKSVVQEREDWAGAIIQKLSKTVFWVMSIFEFWIMEGKTSKRN